MGIVANDFSFLWCEFIWVRHFLEQKHLARLALEDPYTNYLGFLAPETSLPSFDPARIGKRVW